MDKVNLFIVGAGKSGTTALVNQLSTLNEIFLPGIKEPHFFAEYDDQSWAEVDHFGSTYISDKQQYNSLYKTHQNEKYLLDASTSYLHKAGTAGRIYEYNNDAKIVILLRNPVDRAYSHYLMSRRVGHTDSNFLSAMKYEYLERASGISYYVRIGLYASQVEEYLQIFPESNVMVILYDDFNNRSIETFRDLLTFLGIDSSGKDYAFLAARHNETLLPRNRFVSWLARHKLLIGVLKKLLGKRAANRLGNSLYTKKNVRGLTVSERKECLCYFYDDIKKLETILNRDLSAWYELKN